MESKKIIFNFTWNSNIFPMFIKLLSNLSDVTFLEDDSKKLYINETNAFRESHDIYEIVKKSMKFSYNGYEIFFKEGVEDTTDDVIDLKISYLYPNEDFKEGDRFTTYVSIEEIPLTGFNDKYDDALDMKHFVLTCSNLNKEYRNVKFLYKLAFVHYFYHLGYYHLDFDIIKTQKLNLLGTYHRNGYKPERDEAFNLANNIHEIKKYGKYEYDIASVYNMKYTEGWYKNHIIYYYDYIKSVCNIVFESEVPYIFENKDYPPNQQPGAYHISEKTVKAILFSNFEIFFIYYAMPDLVIRLYDDGFWFLNFEFIDFNVLKKETFLNQVKILQKSITDSVEYLKYLNNEAKDLSTIHEDLLKKFGKKLKNNYILFTEILNDKELSKEVVDFILNGYYNNHFVNNSKKMLI